MTSYTFKPGNKKGCNKFVGSWSESASKQIDLPFTVESLHSVLSWGISPTGNDYSDHDITHWCDRFHMANFDVETDRAMDIATGIAADVDAQWNMFLANTYKLEELQSLNFREVNLPVEWFMDWLSQLKMV